MPCHLGISLFWRKGQASPECAHSLLHVHVPIGGVTSQQPFSSSLPTIPLPGINTNTEIPRLSVTCDIDGDSAPLFLLCEYHNTSNSCFCLSSPWFLAITTTLQQLAKLSKQHLLWGRCQCLRKSHKLIILVNTDP